MLTLTRGRNKWGFACGRVAVLAGRLMPYDYFLGLAGLERLEDMFHRLQDSSLREHMFPGALTWVDWSTIIDAYINEMIGSMRRDCPTPALVDMFTLSEDYLNLRHAVVNQPPYPFTPRFFSEERLNEVAARATNLLPDAVRPALAQLVSAGTEGQDPFLVSIALDAAYLRHYLSLARALEAPMIEVWVSDRVLMRAITLLWRCARAGRSCKDLRPYLLPIDGMNGVLSELIEADDPKAWEGLVPGRVGDLFREAMDYPEEDRTSRFDHLASDYLTRRVRVSKLQTTGPERVAGFMWGLRVEAFNLKLVISGKINRIDADALKSRVRETYV